MRYSLLAAILRSTVRIEVDLALCRCHGVCSEGMPEVLRVVERPGECDHVELIVESPEQGLREKLEAAVRDCPNRVLRLLTEGLKDW